MGEIVRVFDFGRKGGRGECFCGEKKRKPERDRRSEFKKKMEAWLEKGRKGGGLLYSTSLH